MSSSAQRTMSPSSFPPTTPQASACTIPQRRMRSRSSPVDSARASSRRRILRASSGEPSSQRRSRSSDAASKAGSPTSGLGSIASQPRSRERRTFPPWKSWCRTTRAASAAGASGRRRLRASRSAAGYAHARRSPVRRDRLRPACGHRARARETGEPCGGSRWSERRTSAPITVARSSSSTCQSGVPGATRSRRSARSESSRSSSAAAP